MTETTTPHVTPTETEAHLLAKRERVRRFLIAPLERDGMVRARNVTAGDHAAFLAKLEARLGYLTDDGLGRLRQLVMADALGTARNTWPGWVSIRARAFALETPPDDQNPIMQSWLHSRRGPELRAQGQLVETYLFLKRMQRPPREFEEGKIADEARENARKRARVLEDIRAGAAIDDDRQWLAWYDRLADICEAIVEAGIAHRKAQAAAERGAA